MMNPEDAKRYKPFKHPRVKKSLSRPTMADKPADDNSVVNQPLDNVKSVRLMAKHAKTIKEHQAR